MYKSEEREIRQSAGGGPYAFGAESTDHKEPNKNRKKERKQSCPMFGLQILVLPYFLLSCIAASSWRPGPEGDAV